MIVVPKVLCEQIHCFGHDSGVNCHLGMVKTLARIQRMFCWFGMAEEIKLAKTCDSCQKSKVGIQKPASFLQPIETTVDPAQHWGVEFHGPLPRGIRGLCFIIFSVDYSTKFVVGKAIKAAISCMIVTSDRKD